jgi:hypothetical protein
VLTACASRCSARDVADGAASDAWLSLHVWCRGADRVRVLGSVTFVMRHTPDGVARGIRAAKGTAQFPKRRTQSFVLTAFASRCSARAVADGTASDAWLSLHVWCRGADRVRALGSVTFVMRHSPDGVARGIKAAKGKARFP